MKRMAKKIKLMPLFQELKGRADISNRRPSASGTGVILMKLREQNSSTALPRRRLTISVNPATNGSLPRPVKIKHVSSELASPSPGARPNRRSSASAPRVRPDAA